MANSALFSQKSSTFDAQQTGDNTISILPHEGVVSDNIVAVVKSGTSTTITIRVESASEPTGAIEYSYNSSPYQIGVSSPVGTVNSFQIVVPIGTHTIKCRLTENGAESQTATIIASRFVILGNGQSNMRGTGADLANPITSQSGHTSWLLRNSDEITVMRSQWDVGTNQVDMVSYDNYVGHAWMMRYANKILAEYDEPVICIPSALGGTTISQHVKNSGYESNGVNMYASSVRRANLIGGVTLHIYQQSENDAIDSIGTTNKSYQSSLDGMITDYYNDLGVETLIMPLHTISRSNYSGTGGTSLDDSGQDALRSAQIAVAASNQHAYIAAPLTSIDLSSGDNIHFRTNSELDAVADAAFYATQQILGEVSKSASFSGAGLTYGDVGSLSISTDVTPQTYITWAQVNNGAPTVAIADPHAATTTFTAPSEDSNIVLAAHVSDGDYVALDQQAFTVSAAEAQNQPPTANAGPDQSVAAATQFTLDGTGSQDTDGTIVEWRWTQTAGDTVTLNLEDPARPTATSPSKTTAQRLTFQLVTVDDEGAVSSPSLVNIDVAAVVQNDVLNIIDKISFTFESDGMITAFPGRANRETFRLKPSDPTGLVLEDGWFDFEANDVRRVEISMLETTGVKIISSDTDSITRERSKLHVRMGDMPIKSSTKEFEPTVSVFVGDDERGVVMTAPGLSGAPKVKYYSTTARAV